MKNSDLESRIKELELELSNLKSGKGAKQESKQTLEENHSNFLTLTNHVSAHIAYINADTLKYEFVNTLYEKSFGFPREKIIGSHIKDIIGETNYKSALKYINEVKSGKTVSDESTFNLTSGKRCIQVNYLPVFDAKSNLVGIAQIGYDITSSKKTEKIVDRNIGAWELNLVDGITWRSLKHDQIFGYKELLPEWTFEMFLEHVIPEDREIVKGKFENATATGTEWNFECRILRKDGIIRWIWAKGSPVLNTNGEPVSMEGIVQDITERKKAENLLKERNQFLTKLNNSLESVVFTVDLESRNIEYVNNRVEAVFGYSPEECIGNGTRFLYPDKNAFIDYGKQMQNAIQKNQEFLIVENTLRKKNGELFSTNINTSFLDKTKVVAVITDITDKKKAEQDLIKAKEIAEINESKFRNLFENSPIGISMTGIDGSLHVNKSFCEIVGYSEEELAGQKWKEISYPEDIPLAEEKTQSLLNGETDKVIFEKRYIHKNGNIIWADVSVYLQRDKQNNPEYYITTIIDITERKHADKSLRSSQEMLLSSQSVANICSYSTNLNLTEINKSFWECSPEFYKIFGIDETYPHTIEGWIGFLHPEYRKDMAAYHESVILEKKSFNREYKIIRINDGLERWVHGTGELVYDDKGNPIRMYGAIQDITERKQLEEEQRKWNMQFAKLSSNAPGLIFQFSRRLDGTYYVPIASEGIKEIFGCSPEDVLEDFSPIAKVIYPDDFDRVVADIENSAKHLTLFTCEFRVQIKGKSIQWMYSKSIPEKLADGTITWYGFVSDITESKRIESDLIKSKEKAEESDRLKSAFLANMSHEIRTPMNGILGFTNLLSKQNLTVEKQQYFIEIIQKSGNRMLDTINDIVDISKIEAGLMNVSITESNINGHIESLHKFFKPEVESKGIQFIVNNGLTSKEAIIKTDHDKIYGILTNLIKNAIKFTTEGRIEFGYVLKSDSETSQSAELEFFVKDTGIGIPKGRLDAIFERFIQADINDTQAFQGSGLGLTISKSYVEMLGGEIWVVSEEKKGTKFYFTIPYTKESKNKTGVGNLESDKVEGDITEGVKIKNLKILVAEDDEVSYSLLTEVLKEISSEVILATNGKEAINMCYNNPDIDLVLMDIKMPEMGGYEATAKIRQFNKDVIIIAQTAYGLAGDRGKAIQAGCNDYISKPVDMALLMELIITHYNK